MKHPKTDFTISRESLASMSIEDLWAMRNGIAGVFNESAETEAPGDLVVDLSHYLDCTIVNRAPQTMRELAMQVLVSMPDMPPDGDEQDVLQHCKAIVAKA